MVKSSNCQRLFTLIVAIVAVTAILQFPMYVDSDESSAADPSYIRAVSIKVFDQDTSDYSDLAYLSDKLPVQFNAAEWVKDAGGLWYNINDRSSDCGKVLRYGAVTNITNEEIRSDVANFSPAFTASSFVLVEIGCEISGDCNLALEIKKDGTSVRTDVRQASTVVSGSYIDTPIQGLYLYSVATSGADINLADFAGLYSVAMKCNGIAAGNATTDYKGTVYTLGGCVKDKRGSEIAGANVSYQITDTEGIIMGEGVLVTGADGKYAIRSVAGTIVNITSVEAEGFSFPVSTYSYGTVTGDVLPGKTFNSNESYIKVVVKDRSGLPASGVEIDATWYTQSINPDSSYRIDASDEGLMVPFRTDSDGTAIITISKIIPGARLLVKGMTGSYTFNDVDPIYATPSTPNPLPSFLSGSGNAYANLTTYYNVSILADDYSVVVTTAGNINPATLGGGAELQGVHLSVLWYYQCNAEGGGYDIMDKDQAMLYTRGFNSLSPGKAWFMDPYSSADGTVVLHYTMPSWTMASPSIGEEAYLYVYADGASPTSASSEYTYTNAQPTSGATSITDFADMYDTCAALVSTSVNPVTLRADEVSYTIYGSVTGDLPDSITVTCTTPTNIGTIKTVSPELGVLEFAFTVKADSSCWIEIDDVVGYTFTNQKQKMRSADDDLYFTTAASATPTLIERTEPVVLETFTISNSSEGDIFTFRCRVAGTDMVVMERATGTTTTIEVKGWNGNIVSAPVLSADNMYISWTGENTIYVAELVQKEIVSYYNPSANEPTIDNIVGGQTIQVMCEGAAYTTVLTDANGKAMITVPDIADITYRLGDLAVTSAPVTSGAYQGTEGLNLKDVIPSPASKLVTVTVRYIATSSLQNESQPTNVDILTGPTDMILTVGESRDFTAPEVEGFDFAGWFINGEKVSNSKNLYICNLSVTEDMDGSTLVASYASVTPEPPKEKFGTTIAIGILAVTIAIIAMIYVILQIRRY